MKENIRRHPIVDNNKVLVGILTNRDLRLKITEPPVSEVMTKSKNLITAPQGTDLKKAEKILQKYKIEIITGRQHKQGRLHSGLITYRGSCN